jgi:putative copper resistance protein D
MLAIEATASFMAYSTLALVVGSLMTAGLLLPQGEPVLMRQHLVSLSQILLPLFVLASIVSLVVQGTKLNSGAWPSFDLLCRYLSRTQIGKIWSVRQIYALAFMLGIAWYKRTGAGVTGARIGLALSLPLVASRSLTSHAVSVREFKEIAVSADALHLLATAVWAGGLPILFWVLYRGTRKLHMAPSWTAETVRRFSWLALVAVTVLAITGLYQSWIQVQQLALLFETPYGQVLMLKLLLFLCMIIVGAVNLFSTKPKLLHSAKTQRLPNWRQKKMLRCIGGEALLGIGVFCVTGFLTLLPPGIHSLHDTRTGGLQAYPERLNLLTRLAFLFTPAPKLQPAQGAKVTIIVPREGQVFHGDQIPLRYDFTPGKIGNHVHAYVDGELMGMFSDTSNDTLTGIKPGKHVLELRVTTADHVTELDARDKVGFVVQ